jgi:hypothetical protein
MYLFDKKKEAISIKTSAKMKENIVPRASENRLL